MCLEEAKRKHIFFPRCQKPNGGGYIVESSQFMGTGVYVDISRSNLTQPPSQPFLALAQPRAVQEKCTPPHCTDVCLVLILGSATGYLHPLIILVSLSQARRFRPTFGFVFPRHGRKKIYESHRWKCCLLHQQTIILHRFSNSFVFYFFILSV